MVCGTKCFVVQNTLNPQFLTDCNETWYASLTSSVDIPKVCLWFKVCNDASLCLLLGCLITFSDNSRYRPFWWFIANVKPFRSFHTAHVTNLNALVTHKVSCIITSFCLQKLNISQGEYCLPVISKVTTHSEPSWRCLSTVGHFSISWH